MYTDVCEQMSFVVTATSQLPELHCIGMDCADTLPIHFAAATGSKTLLGYFLDRTSPKDWLETDANKRTLLHYLCAGAPDLVAEAKRLITYAPSLVQAADCLGRRPLHYAAQVLWRNLLPRN
jgi:hypothetical protein